MIRPQGAAEQVRPDLHRVVAPLVALGADADQRGGFREQRQLDRRQVRGAANRAFGHDVTGNVSRPAAPWQEKPLVRAD
jgi:hypothetical protein